MIRPRFALALLVLVSCVVPAAAQLQGFKRSEVTVTTADGPHRFAVELALDPEQMAQGLMFRQSLPADAGMLFDYGTPRPVAFWMKNTLIPLDLLFIGTDGRVVNIHERAIPQTLDSIPSDGPVRAVLELNGGTSARLGIKPGDLVSGPAFPKPAS